MHSTNPRVKTSPPPSKELRECFYCHKTGHVIADCLTLKRKQQPKPVGFVKTVPMRSDSMQRIDEFDERFKPFVMKGLLSINGRPEDQKEVQILRDTGASQSFVISDVIPLSEQTSCDSSVLIQGIEMGVAKEPLHCVHLQCELLTGFVKVRVRSSFPVKGVAFILSNDLAGGKVTPVVKVVDRPDCFVGADDIADEYPDVFAANVMTCTQAQIGNDITLNDSFILPLFAEESVVPEPQVVNDKKSCYLLPGTCYS
ncbi:Gag-Pol polyprotein [Labeo rohita]|uniref:Gag-Pol polyprotein n=1 Tax=Labeo rohita TaxID=84645 RepID=A0ABQ8MAY7_LABRO|nr:Gag-Pol polyprotein [Labeo rohita]